jgi:hypothetical protein
MSDGAKGVLAAFEELSPAEREEVVMELLRRAALGPHDVPGDEDRVRTADDVFLELDRGATEG